ncbi:MAG: DNA translocase FtsK 4TM domain-containing protein [Candidatus Cloacimonadota bacterium]|nr:DNA translocase FtsK 4TM domain-containing protein [Candidatus Cloacimonadota bacterium]
MKKTRIFPIILSIVLILIFLLLLIASCENKEVIKYDYNRLQEESLNLIKLVKLEVPELQNPIGIFGAFFAYWLLKLMGQPLAVAFLAGLILILFFANIWKNRKYFWKAIIAIVVVLMGEIFYFSLQTELPQFAGLIPLGCLSFLTNFFDTTGTAIISAALFLAGFIFIIEPHIIKKILLFIFTLFVQIIKLIKKIFSKKSKLKSKPKAKKNKKEKYKPNIKENKPRDEEVFIEEKEPQINKGTDKKIVSKPSPRKVNNSNTSYVLPDINEFLISKRANEKDREKIEKNIHKTSQKLEKKLAEFDVDVEVVNVNIGPIITQYELKLAPAVKVSKISTLADDLALAIKAKSIRVQAPIPGKDLVGIELPNNSRTIIYLKDVLLSEKMQNCKEPLAIALGKDISGEATITDLSAMPHLLIAGATGSGKSVCINTIINSFLLRATPEEVRFIMIDPKRIELAGYEGIPHLIENVVTDNEDAMKVLNWSVSEMERRYTLLQKYKVRNLKDYNSKIEQLQATEEKFTEQTLPFIIIIIDEMADLMMTVGKDVEKPLTRLAQMARAIGIHLILATQRPSSNIITGIIKTNFPCRIAFKVGSKIDSRVIIDSNGAEKLLGKGDMLFLPPGSSDVERIHGAYISDIEIENIVDYWVAQPKPEQEIMILEEDENDFSPLDYDDDYFPEAARYVVKAGNASVSMLQRHFSIGYARAGRLIDLLERSGIIGPHKGSKPREVLATEEDLKIYGFLNDEE